ncbi:glycosyltransferase [Sphingomonas sp. BGYR3]|uniref:glycosyltransferase family 2 protein n=1 Tax=Sphingomonas sp. BGYR3 TaxID=2975483 RepID=UPI0021A345E8|nr:glycosyltransferase [Sphingomonas sp. BGYR3]MDG5487815.1 glycosyltransferase [Sphingomonas sp. BGYR3]
MSTVSVLTLVKNRAAHLKRLVEGLARSTCLPAELIVVDMASDRPVVIPPQCFPVTTVLLDRPGLPLAEARNLAASTARSPILLFLDVDCIPAAGLVGAIAAACGANDALLSAEVRYLPPGAVADDWSKRQLLARAIRHPARLFPGAGQSVAADHALFWSLAFGVSAERFAAVGGFDPAFTGYGAEDTDFAFRLRDAGVPHRLIGGAGAFHQHHAAHDPPLQHFADIVANARRFHDRWQRWPMEGWLDAFQGLGLIARKGHAIQVLRHPSADEVSASKVDRAFA